MWTVNFQMFKLVLEMAEEPEVKLPTSAGSWKKQVQFSSVTQSCPTLCNPMNHSTPGLPVHHQLPEFTQIHIHRVSDAIQPSHPLSSPSSPASNPSQHQSLFQWSTLHMRWPKYWSFSFSIIPSKEIPRLISFRMDWLDLLAVQGTLKSLLQHHSAKASILRHLSHPKSQKSLKKIPLLGFCLPSYLVYVLRQNIPMEGKKKSHHHQIPKDNSS